MAYRNGNPRSGAHAAKRRTTPDSRETAFEGSYEDFKRPDSHSHASGYSRSHARLDSEALTRSRKKRKKKKIITGVIAAFLVLILGGGGVAFAYLNSINSNLHLGVGSDLLAALMPTDTPSDPFYVLLLGTDGSAERESSSEYADGHFRSDSMMLARIDPRNKKCAIVSIPRDTRVELGKYGKQKINAAHAFGGPALAVETVSKMAGVPISHYAEINFDGFANIVDALGGIEVDVPIEIDDDEAGGYLSAGVQTLNGQGALILCRSRHSYDSYGDGDLFRAANQRMVLAAIAQKLLESDVLTITNSVNALSQYVITDLDIAAIASIAKSMRGIDAENDIYSAIAPTESQYIDGGWYEILDEKAWKEMIERLEAGLPPIDANLVDASTGTVLASAGDKAGESGNATNYRVNSNLTIRLRNGNGRDKACTAAYDILHDMGYRNINSGNANSFDYPETLIIYKDSSKEKAASQIASALGTGKALKDDGTYLFESDFLIVIGADWPE